VTFDKLALLDLFVTTFINAYVVSEMKGILQGCWSFLSPTRKETSYSNRRFWVSYTLFI